METMNAFRRLLLLLALLSFCSLQPASAWDSTGHQVVAAIAWSQLTKNSQDKLLLLFPDDLKSKEEIVFVRAPREGTPQDPFPRLTYNHITISNWMDDIRSNSYDKSLNDWHYIGRPFFDGVPVKLAVPNSPNIREKIIEQIRVLQKSRHFDQADKEHKDEKTQAAYAVAVLIHLIGDVHQPLHCINRYSLGFDEGDEGGNGFPLDFPQAPKLHTYWDGAGGLFDFIQLGRDYDEHQQQQIAEDTSRVLKRWNPAEHPESKSFNIDDWVDESYQLARTQVYTGIKPKGTPDAAYAEKTKQIAAERIGLAGYRLAAVLNAIFGQP